MRSPDEMRVLAAYEGTWDATVKSYSAGPFEPPGVSRAVEINRLLTGGLWLTSNFDGDVGGVRVEGRGQFGYDPRKKTYIGSWVDTRSDTMLSFVGAYDAKQKTMVYVSEPFDVIGKPTATVRKVIKTHADGSRVCTTFFKPDKDLEEVKIEDILYKKRPLPGTNEPDRSGALMPPKKVEIPAKSTANSATREKS
jgi:hypothetical protein